MKFAFCVEDETDKEAFRLLLSRVLQTDVEADAITYRFPPGGWTKALQLAPAVARRAYHAGLDGALFAIDNDGVLPVHEASHAESPSSDCRTCLLRREAKLDEPLSWPRPGLSPLRYVLTVPVQTIESWLLLGMGHPYGTNPQLGKDPAGRRALKKAVYGHEIPDSRTMLEVTREHVPQLDLARLERESVSFKHFLAQLR